MDKKGLEAALDGRLINNQDWSTLVTDEGKNDINILWMRRGFDAWATGGGCMAWRLDEAERYVVVTNQAGDYLPDSPEFPVAVGIYETATGREIMLTDYPNTSLAMAALAREGIIPPDPVPAFVAIARAKGMTPEDVLRLGGVVLPLDGGGLWEAFSLLLETHKPVTVRKWLE